MITIMAVVFMLGLAIQGKEISRLKNINQTNSARQELVKISKDKCVETLAITDYKMSLCANDLTLCKAKKDQCEEIIENQK